MGCALAAKSHSCTKGKRILRLEGPALYAATMVSFGVVWVAFVVDTVEVKEALSPMVIKGVAVLEG